MFLNRSDINSKRRLTHLQADDLFDNGTIQVFHARTGKYLGIAYKGNPICFEDQQDDPQPEAAPPTPKAQLKLF